MNTLMERGIAMINRAAPQVSGGVVVYQRATSRVSVNATFGRTEFQIDDANGTRLVHSDRDFIVESALLTLDGARVKPQRGDRITLVDPAGGFGDVYEVLAPGGMDVYGEDPTQTRMRIHGKKLQ